MILMMMMIRFSWKPKKKAQWEVEEGGEREEHLLRHNQPLDSSGSFSLSRRLHHRLWEGKFFHLSLPLQNLYSFSFLPKSFSFPHK